MKNEYTHINIENEVQDKSSEAWEKLCAYVDMVAERGDTKFSPAKYLGREFYQQIHTLPASIQKLKQVKEMYLYGSQLKRIPPEIGAMESLEIFEPYTSYQLHWFPYEITRCKNLKNSTVSTRALYGNYKFRSPFPDLNVYPVKYEGNVLKCSVCQREINQEDTNQLWITLRVATDVLPLLVNSCSDDCERQLPTPPKAYVQYPHKGGPNLIQPSDEEWREAYEIKYTAAELEEMLKQYRKNQKDGK